MKIMIIQYEFLDPKTLGIIEIVYGSHYIIISVSDYCILQ